MQIFNRTKDTLVAQRAEIADTFWKRLKGRLATKNWSDCDGLILLQCHSIHTIGMRYPLDVIFCSASGKVLKTHSGVKGWHIIVGPKNSEIVIELPEGNIERAKIVPNDVIKWER